MERRFSWWTLAALTAAGAAAVTACFWVGARAVDVPFSYVSREPQTAQPGALSWYAGSFSNLTILVLVTAAAVSLFTGAARWTAVVRDERTGFLLWSGLFMGFLALDDLFLLHESVYSRIVPEQFVSPAYAIPAAALVWWFRSELRREDGPLFLAGGVALLVSVSTSELWDGHHLVEDGTKFLGYALWATFFLRLAFASIRELPAVARN